MTAKSSDAIDLSALQTDVALLKQFNEKVAEPSLKKIQVALEGLDYVHRAEFEEYKEGVNIRFNESKRRTWVQNTLSAIAGAVLTILATYAISDFHK